MNPQVEAEIDTLFNSPTLNRSLSDLGLFAVDFCNHRAFPSSLWKLCGYDADDILDGWLEAILHPEDRTWVLPRLRDLWEARADRFEGVFRLRSRDGQWLWVAANYRVAHRGDDGVPMLFVGHDQDVTTLKRSEEDQRRRLIEINTLRLVIADVNASLDLNETVSSILAHTRRVIPHHKGTVQLVEPGRLRIIGSVGFTDPQAPLALVIPFPENRSPSTTAVLSRVPVICNNVPRDFPEFRHLEGEPPVLSWLGIPLIVGGEVIGLLALDSLEEGFYDEHHLEMAEILAGHLALAVDKARLFENVRTMALTDLLTGAGNRHALQMQGPFFFEKARREGKPLVALMADLDQFKGVNDTWGHDVGDRVLNHAAGIIRSCLRSYDLLFRYGGEEFLVLLPDTGMNDAQAIAERIRAAMPSAPADLPATTVSIGVGALVPKVSQGLSDLIKVADRALYRAKTAGRNRVETLGE